MRQILSIFTLLLATYSLCAQTDARTRAINEQFRIGEQLLLEEKYKPALKIFDKILNKNPDHIASYRASGICYELSGQHAKALSSYFNVLSRDPYFSRIIYYEIGRTYYRLGQYHSALDYFSQFAGLQNLSNDNFGLGVEREQAKELEYLQELSQSMLACQISVDSIQYLNIDSVSNVGFGINTPGDEYFPSVSHSGDLMFFTRREDTQKDENLFSSQLKKEKWQESIYNVNFNSRHNEGMSTLIKSGRHMYFTACGRSDVLGNCDIWEAKVDGKRVSKIKSTKGYLNSERWESQAAISCDGRTIFFASDREGSLGGTDIWMSEREPDGSWAEPTNLGTSVNTAANEEAPFITNDGKTLYFSSFGHFGMGGEDIYYSKLQRGGKWSKARNLGAPVNSSARELGFFLTADGRTGYFASDREGGAGGIDIYQFKLPNQLLADPVTYVEGIVKGKIDDLPIRPATVNIEGRDPIEVDERGRFFICVPGNEKLKVSVEAMGYRPYKETVEIPVWDNTEFYPLDLLLEFDMPAFAPDTALNAVPVSLPVGQPDEKIVLEKISTLSVYYDTNQSDLTSENKIQLEHFLKIFQQDKITKVEIVGFADYVGSDADNMKLSEARAKIVADFIQKKGVEVNKFYLEGRGDIGTETNLDRNRRVDIIVHSKLN
ncbi:MAG: OmpA family protein [Bacteroidota bacterium]